MNEKMYYFAFFDSFQYNTIIVLWHAALPLYSCPLNNGRRKVHN